MKHLKKITLLLTISIALLSCGSLKTAVFDQYAYQKSIEIKIESENLMDKATTPYSSHLKEIGELGLEIEKIVEYEKNRPDNEITYAMWKLLADKDKNLLVGFFKRWQQKGQLNAVFIEEAKQQITKAMDLLIQYEAKKDKETKDKLLQLIAGS